MYKDASHAELVPYDSKQTHLTERFFGRHSSPCPMFFCFPILSPITTHLLSFHHRKTTCELKQLNSKYSNSANFFWNMKPWSPKTSCIQMSWAEAVWKHPVLTHPQASHLRDPLVEIQHKGAYLLIPLRWPWVIFVQQKHMGWNDKKVKLRSELVVELLDVAGVVVLGRRVKCRGLQEIYELNKMLWLECFNVGDQGRTPSRDHLIWKSLGVSKVLTCAPRKMQHFQTHSFFPTCRTNLAYAIRSISFNQTKIHPNCGQPCWKTTGSCCPIRWFSPSAKPLSPPCLDARSCKHFLLMPSGFPFQKDIIWSEMKQVFPGFLWGKGSADVRTISSNMIFVLNHVDVSWELMVLGDW